jgi:hypothetical protein
VEHYQVRTPAASPRVHRRLPLIRGVMPLRAKIKTCLRVSRSLIDVRGLEIDDLKEIDEAELGHVHGSAGPGKR